MEGLGNAELSLEDFEEYVEEVGGDRLEALRYLWEETSGILWDRWKKRMAPRYEVELGEE
jgi:hypothetical protein